MEHWHGVCVWVHLKVGVCDPTSYLAALGDTTNNLGESNVRALVCVMGGGVVGQLIAILRADKLRKRSRNRKNHPDR